MSKLLHLDFTSEDAKRNLQHAYGMAARLSTETGNEWIAMREAAQKLDAALTLVNEVRVLLRDTFEDAHSENERVADMADAASY